VRLGIDGMAARSVKRQQAQRRAPVESNRGAELWARIIFKFKTNQICIELDPLQTVTSKLSKIWRKSLVIDYDPRNNFGH
jgi:hypothetical protein